MTTTITGDLKRALRLRDLVLLNIVAVYTPSTVGQTLQMGRAGLTFWAVAALCFMLPYAAAVADLSLKHPREGGVYAWTRMAFGGFHGFLCGWCYWVNTFLYVPSIFVALVSVAALLGGERTAWINDSPLAVTIIAGGALWLSAALHIFGLGQGKWIQNLGAFGRLAMAAAIVAVGAWVLLRPTGNVAAMTTAPLTAWGFLSLWPFALNALVGLDLGSAMSEEADDPRRDIPRALLIGGLAVAICYVITYAAVLVIGVGENNAIYGHLLALNAALQRGGLAGFGVLLVLIELLGLLGCGASWLAAPARVPFAIGIDRYLPQAFARVHPRYGTPYVALLVQAGVASVLIFINTYGAKLQEAYLALLGSSIVLVMVTYVYLFAAWVKLNRAPRVVALSVVGLLATLTAIACSFIPPPLIGGVAGFELKIIGSVAAMLLCGLAAYFVGASRSKNESEKIRSA